MADPKRPRPAAPSSTRSRGKSQASAGAPDAATRQKEEAARAFAIAAARSMHDDKCTDVVALDVRGRSQVTDFIVVGSGASERQMRSAGQRVADLGETSGFALFRSNKDQPGQTWFVLDFVDVVAHVFDPGARAYYDLEMMWGDAPRLAWERPAPPAPTLRAAPAKPGPKAAPVARATKKAPATRAPKAAASKARATTSKTKPRPAGAKRARKSKA